MKTTRLAQMKIMEPQITQISTDVVARNEMTKQSHSILSWRLPRLRCCCKSPTMLTHHAMTNGGNQSNPLNPWLRKVEV